MLILDDSAFEFNIDISRSTKALEAKAAKIPLSRLGPSLTEWEVEEAEDVHLAVTHILDLVHAAGADGLTRAELAEKTGYPVSTLYTVFASLATDSTSEVFWAGYDTARLISAEHWNEWTHAVAVKGEVDLAQIRPRRWIDIYGEMLKEDWERCLRCAMGHLMTRPGILAVCPLSA
jgi:hypothetical protein